MTFRALYPLLMLGACTHSETARVSQRRMDLPEFPSCTWTLPEVPVVSSTAIEVTPDPNVLRNVAVAAEYLDGVTLFPGEEFSFNRTVGPRTPERGFVQATTLFMATETTDYGGGVCVVASALFVALRRGGYAVTERHAHSRPRPYVPLGLDAAVNYPDLDLRFRNDRNDAGYSLTLRAHLDAAALTVSIETYAPRVEASSRWVALPTVSPPVREYRSTFVTKRRVHTPGAVGTPGRRIWTYAPKGILPTVSDLSDYRPVTELVLVPADETEGG